MPTSFHAAGAFPVRQTSAIMDKGRGPAPLTPLLQEDCSYPAKPPWPCDPLCWAPPLSCLAVPETVRGGGQGERVGGGAVPLDCTLLPLDCTLLPALLFSA